MSNPPLVPSALRRFFAPQHGLHLPWLALLPRSTSPAPTWVDFADTQPGVFHAETRIAHETERSAA